MKGLTKLHRLLESQQIHSTIHLFLPSCTLRFFTFLFRFPFFCFFFFFFCAIIFPCNLGVDLEQYKYHLLVAMKQLLNLYVAIEQKNDKQKNNNIQNENPYILKWRKKFKRNDFEILWTNIRLIIIINK